MSGRHPPHAEVAFNRVSTEDDVHDSITTEQGDSEQGKSADGRDGTEGVEGRPPYSHWLDRLCTPVMVPCRPGLLLLVVLVSLLLLHVLWPMMGWMTSPSSSSSSAALPSPSVSTDVMVSDAEESLSRTTGSGGSEGGEGDSFSHAERQALFILTGISVASPATPGLIPASLRARLRSALDGLALTVLSLRPSLQRELWLTDCGSYLPCPYPSHITRQHAKGSSHLSDQHTYDTLTSRTPWLISTLLDGSSPPSADSLFHPRGDEPHSPSFIPGEDSASQQLSFRFQSELRALQFPVDCSTARLLVMDFNHDGGGFGSWMHSRAASLGVGFRSQRTTVDAPGVGGYVQGYSDCTREVGLMGCDLLLPITWCHLPADWQERWELEKATWLSTHKETAREVGAMTPSQRIEYYHEKRILRLSEVQAEQFELHHIPRSGWQREQLEQLPEPMAYLRPMPSCWWNRQLLSYLFRLTRDTGQRLLSLLAQSLRLPEPNITAHYAQLYADTRATDPTHTAHTWLSFQAIKLTWQLHLIDPTLIHALRLALHTHQSSAVGEEDSTPPLPSSSPLAAVSHVPLLGYAFIRHGDKGREAAPLNDSSYADLLLRLSQRYGLRMWYVGADDLLSPYHVVELGQGHGEAPLTLFTSALVDSLSPEQRAAHPLARGFDWNAARQASDVDREGVVWRTILELGVALVSDVYATTWSSNHPRMAYELGTAVSDLRGQVPIFTLDGGVVASPDSAWVDITKHKTVEKC